MNKRPQSKMAVAMVLLGTFGAVPALSQQHRAVSEHERYQTPHWVFDDRYHHGHYYPSVGYSMAVLPAGNIAISFGGGRFFFRSGVWFQPARSGYVVVRPPVGIVVPVLPPAYTIVWAGGVPYYYANEVYYAQAPGGYVVAAPPRRRCRYPRINRQHRRHRRRREERQGLLLSPYPEPGITANRQGATTPTLPRATRVGDPSPRPRRRHASSGGTPRISGGTFANEPVLAPGRWGGYKSSAKGPKPP